MLCQKLKQFQTINGCRSLNALAVAVTVTLGTENFNNNLRFSIYPNPVVEILNIAMKTELKSVEIYSVQGQKIFSANAQKVDVSNFAAGIYLIRVEDIGGEFATQRFIKK